MRRVGEVLIAALLAGAAAWALAVAAIELTTPYDSHVTWIELQRQNAALRDSLAAERGWDTTPPGFIREICEAEDG